VFKNVLVIEPTGLFWRIGGKRKQIVLKSQFLRGNNMKKLLKNVLFLALVGSLAIGSARAECNKSVKQTADMLVEFRVAQLKGLSSDITTQDLQECVEFYQTDSSIGSDIGEVFSDITKTISSQPSNY
jgi:hypothetical protein